MIALATALFVKGLDLLGGLFGDRRKRKAEEDERAQEAALAARVEDRKDARDIDRELRGRLERVEAKYESLYEKYLTERELRLKAEAKEAVMLVRLESAMGQITSLQHDFQKAQETISTLQNQVEELRTRVPLGEDT
jgi:chromosome segregation ATPase